MTAATTVTSATAPRRSNSRRPAIVVPPVAMSWKFTPGAGQSGTVRMNERMQSDGVLGLSAFQELVFGQRQCLWQTR